MRKLSVILSFICILVLTLSCSNKKSQTKNPYEGMSEQEQIEVQPRIELSNQDTTQLISQANQFFEYVKNQQIDQAVSMLFYLTDDEKVLPLSKDRRAKQVAALKAFHVYDVSIEDMKFFNETDCLLKCKMQISPSVEGKTPAYMSCMFRPVRRDGKWYLTPANSTTDKNSQLEN